MDIQVVQKRISPPPPRLFVRVRIWVIITHQQPRPDGGGTGARGWPRRRWMGSLRRAGGGRGPLPPRAPEAREGLSRQPFGRGPALGPPRDSPSLTIGGVEGPLWMIRRREGVRRVRALLDITHPQPNPSYTRPNGMMQAVGGDGIICGSHALI